MMILSQKLAMRRSLGHAAHAAGRQRGVTLVIALIFMVALTLLGVGMVRSTTSEERMSSNSRDYDLAFAAAEAALRDAEIRINGSSPSSTTPLAYTDFPTTLNTCANGLCVFDDTNTTPIWSNTTYTFESTYAATYGYLTSVPALDMQGFTSTAAPQPKYFIELAKRPSYGSSNPKDTLFYRISAKGYGARGNTQVLLQEAVRLP